MQDIRVPKKRNGLRAAGAFSLLVVVFCTGLYLGVHEALLRAQAPVATSTAPGVTSVSLDFDDRDQPSDVDMSQFWRAWKVLQESFVEVHASGTLPNEEEQIYGAIRGLVESYGDPYTVFFEPPDAAIFNADVKGSFGGVGMEVGSDNSGNLIVVAPLKDSPAFKAGILAGDRIVAIGATSSATMPPDAAVKLIRGEVGTVVKITIMRNGGSEPVIISIKRDTIVIPTIDYKHVGGGIYEISLYNFSATSANDFRRALRAFIESGDKKLLLDLRGNPGGYLDASVDMASYFLPAGAVIVTEDFRGKHADVHNRSLGYNVFAWRKLKMAVLVDRGSASAAEILAGALQQHGVAVLVGTRTFGKGSVQQLIDIGGGAELKVTVARWLTPDGTSISDGGLMPDITASTTIEDIKAGNDPQKEAAINYLRSQ